VRPSQLAFVGLGMLAVWMTFEWQRLRPVEPTAPPRETVFSPFLGMDLRTGDLSRLAELKWQEVESTINHLSVDSMARDRAIEELLDLQSSSAIYARAFLLAGRGDVSEGWHTLQNLDLTELPGAYTYAAWRLGVEANAGVNNRFWAAVKLATNAGELSGLRSARVRGVAGEWQLALTDYLASDPAQWTSFDLSVLAGSMRLAGWRGEVGALILAALKAGRMPVELRAEAAKLIAPSQTEKISQANWTAWQNAAAKLPELQDLMVAVVEQQLELRQRFAKGDHRGVIELCRDLDPKESGDETILLAVLAAAVTPDAGEGERWSEEILRRNPQPEVKKWITQIRSETGM
jgi:hypothetical protein